VFGAALYVPFRHHLPRQLAFVGAFGAVAPDFDVVGFRFGIEYADPLGHRGLTHSLLFAAVLAAGAVGLLSRSLRPGARFPAWLYLALATASHGVFDAFTNGGLGVAH
jgi:inner membrane protein